MELSSDRLSEIIREHIDADKSLTVKLEKIVRDRIESVKQRALRRLSKSKSSMDHGYVPDEIDRIAYNYMMKLAATEMRAQLVRRETKGKIATSIFCAVEGAVLDAVKMQADAIQEKLAYEITALCGDTDHGRAW